MILIVSDPRDPHIYPVIAHLRAKHARFCVADLADLPQRASLSAHFGGAGSDTIVRTARDAAIEWCRISSVWYRKPSQPTVPNDLVSAERGFVLSETRELIDGLYGLLGHAYWLNPLPNIREANRKLLQLKLAHELGLDVPRTIVTNDPSDAYDFFLECGRQAVYKPLRSGMLGASDDFGRVQEVTDIIYTSRIDHFTREDFERVRLCPVLLQEYVEKSFEVRVTVVNESMFAAAIDSQSQPGSRIDWRQEDAYLIPHTCHELPDDAASMVRELMKRLGLRFGAVDFIVTPDGRYVFLEINPNGNYLWIEKMLGFPISQAIGDALHAE